MTEEDILLSNFLKESSTNLSQINISDEPRILSISDTINLVKKTYGENWKENYIALAIVFDEAKIFIRSDLEENMPDLLDQFDDYQKTKKIKGKEIPQDWVSKWERYMSCFPAREAPQCAWCGEKKPVREVVCNYICEECEKEERKSGRPIVFSTLVKNAYWKFEEKKGD